MPIHATKEHWKDDKKVKVKKVKVKKQKPKMAEKPKAK
jgi:hypothetical protein